MNPILFSENSTVFTSNGIGRLSDAIKCLVTEERNGIYELEMTYPMDGQHYSDIEIRSIIVAKPSPDANPQPFRVYKITKPIGGKSVIYAQHLSYDLSKNTCMPFEVTASGSACSSALSGLKSHAVDTCPFSFDTNVTTVASYTQLTPSSIKKRLGGTKGSILDQFGGEYEYDIYNVHLWRERGTVTDVVLRYGKNITDLEQEENIANTVTGVVPYWTNMDGDQIITLPEKVVRSSHASEYSSFLTVPLDLSSEWDEAPTAEALRAAATVYVNQQGFGVPKVSTTVSFVNLADTEEYKDLIPLQNVNLCDTITVQFEKLGIDTTAKIVKTVYNVLKEKYDELQVGSLKSNLASTITDMEASTVQSISDTGKRVFAEANTEAQDLVNNATAWLTSSGGYVIAVKNQDGTWKELLFMDTNDITTAHNVLRINENGLGFSRNGVGGPYTQAWTLDGKLVVGGTNVPSITCYDSNNRIVFQASASGAIFNSGVITLKDTNDNVIFQASSSGVIVNSGVITLKNGNNTIFQASSSGVIVNSGVITLKNGNNTIFKASSAGVIWNATNSSMDVNGHLEATNMRLSGGELILGGNKNGQIDMKDSYNVLRGRWSKDQFIIYDGDGTMSDNILFKADGDGAIIRGELDLKIDSDNRVRIMNYNGNAAIFFDGDNGDSYIDGTGSGSDGGINMNAERVVFSVDDLGVTEYRGSTNIRNGWTGSVLCNDGYIRDVINGLIVE